MSSFKQENAILQAGKCYCLTIVWKIHHYLVKICCY